MNMRYWMILIIIGAAFGCSFGINEVLLENYGALTVSALRIVLGAIGCWIFVLATGRKGSISPSLVPLLAVFGTFQFAAPFAILPLAQIHIASSTAGIVNAFTPVAVLLISHFWPGGARATLPKTIAAFIGVVGVSFMVAGKAAASGADAVFVALAVLAPVSYGIALNIVRSFRDMDPIVMTTWAMTFGGLVMMPVAILFDGPPAVHDVQSIVALGVLGFLLTSATFLTMYSVLPKVGALNLSLVTFVAPVFALAIGTLAFGEILSQTQVFGTVLILLALIVMDGRLVGLLRATALPTLKPYP